MQQAGEASHIMFTSKLDEAKKLKKALTLTSTEGSMLNLIREWRARSEDTETSAISTGFQLEVANLVGGIIAEDDVLPALVEEATRLASI